MELVIRMKNITRFLIFLAAALVWLVALVLLNGAFLNVDETPILIATIVLALASTFVVAKALHT